MLIIQPTAPTVPGKHENLLPGARPVTTFKPGQLLEATVLSSSRDGLVQLRIGNTELTAHTQVSLPQNAHVDLKVIQLQPQLLLKILPAPQSGVQSPENSTRQPLRDAMLTLLPKQASALPLLTAISQPILSKQLTAALPTLQPLIRQLLNAMPTRMEMSQPAGIRQAVLQSGVFYEARLVADPLSSQLDPAPDIKVMLSRLLAGVERATSRLPASNLPMNSSAATNPTQESVPPPLRGSAPAIHKHAALEQALTSADINAELMALPRKLEGALSRISLLQLATAENFNDGQMLWQLEIPVRHQENIDMVALTIEREQHDPGETDENWVVNLALDLPQLGPLQIHISMNQQGIHSNFRAQSHASLELIESRLSKLHIALEQKGLKIQSLTCRSESVPCDTRLPETAPLIDEQA